MRNKQKYYLESLILGLLMIGMTVHAQFFTQMSLMTPHYYPGEVYFTDGHHEAYDEVELPRVDKNKLHVKKHTADKERESIDATDIIGIKIWHVQFPDKVHTLYYVHAKKSMMQSDSQWGIPVASSAWGVLYQCEINYEMQKNGDLECVKFVGGNGPDTPTLFYLKRTGVELADLLIWGGAFPNKKKAAELFKENAEIASGIKSGKLKADDIQYILDEMAGGQTQKNGVAGDDK